MSKSKYLMLKLLALVIIFLLLISYVGYSEYYAASKAKEFCQAINPGQTTQGILEQAHALGADKQHTKWYESANGEHHLPVTFLGGMPLSRHVCGIKSTADVVISARVFYVD